MENVSAIVLNEHGDPEKVARVESIALPPPGPGEARVRVLLAPINPADINVLEGRYPVRPQLPGTPGVEGVGVVESSPSATLKPGTMVLLPHGFGCWRAAGNAKVDALQVVPADIPPPDAAMLRINPPTALRMIRDFVNLQPGDWVIQNAANSGVGRAVIQLCAHAGIRTFNVVRRPELFSELQAIGADAVALDDESLPETLHGATGGRPVSLALNAVGGESALRLANALAEGGTLATYGAMSKQPLRIPNGLLIFRDIAFRGFWVTRWYQHATPAQKQAMADELFEMVRTGKLHTPVEATYPLTRITEALAHARRSGRAGKILLECNA